MNLTSAYARGISSLARNRGMTNAQEFIGIPASTGHRARRVRPEDHPRLREVTPTDRHVPWVRITRDGQLGYARVCLGQPATMEFVPDDGESRYLSTSRSVAAADAGLGNIRAAGRRSAKSASGKGRVASPRFVALVVPPAIAGEPTAWWGTFDPETGAIGSHVLAPARWVSGQVAIRDPDAERHAKALAKKRARSES